MAITAASYTLNSSASPTPLTPNNGTVSANIDLVATHGALFYHCDSTNRHVIINLITVNATNDGSGTNTDYAYVAREPYKFTMQKSPSVQQAALVGSNTKLKDCITAPNGVLGLSFFEPYINQGTGSYGRSQYTASDINKLFKIGRDVRVGLKLNYSKVGGTFPSLYIDANASEKEWTHSYDAQSVKTGCGETYTTVNVGTLPTTVAIFSCENILSQILDSSLLGLFSLTISDVVESSEMTITPFLYVGTPISGVSSTPPLSYSRISVYTTSTSQVSQPLSYTTHRIASGWGTEAMDVTNTSATLGNTLSDGVGFVGNFDQGTTDTSITITIG